MKKLLICLSSILLLALIGCKNREHQYTYYDDAKQKPKEIFEVDVATGKKDGSYKKFYENGNLHLEMNYKNGKANGSIRIYSEKNGELLSKGKTPFPESKKNTMKDPRDGKTYKTVKIGNQVWMAENLNYKTENSYCYGNDPANCAKYGRLYTWKATLNACPEGWHLPTSKEFKTLISNVGGEETAGKMLKSTTGWKDDDGESGNGVDAFGFNVLPAGVRNYFGNFFSAGEGAGFWSATEGDEDGAYLLYTNYYSEHANLYGIGKDDANSVRCLRDSNSDTRDDQTYKTVKIGKQVWMAENLNYQTENSYCYENDPANCEKYGRLYTWKAALNACPSGWHLPTEEEFETLRTNVGGRDVAGKMLKSTTGWYKEGNGIDIYGFNVLPAGFCNYFGDFRNAGRFANFWSATEVNESLAYSEPLYRDDEDAYLELSDKDYALSVRCLRD